MGQDNTPIDKQQAKVPGGSIIVARRLFKSDIFVSKPPLYLKLFLWILYKARYEDGSEEGVLCRRGELVVTYREILEAMTHKYKKPEGPPKLKAIRCILQYLQDRETIIYRPVHDYEKQGQRKGRPTGTSGAYVGIKIRVINYATYQTQTNYRGRRSGRPSDELGQVNTSNVVNEEKKDVRDKERPASLVPLKGKGPKQKLLNPQVEELLVDWKIAVKQHPKFGTEPEITSKDRAAMSRAQRKWPPDLIRTLFEFHLDSWKADKSGPSLSTAFSEDSYNSFTREWKNRRYAYGDTEDPLIYGLRWWTGEDCEGKKYRDEHGQGRRQNTTSSKGV